MPVIDPGGGGDIYALTEALEFLMSDSKESSKFVPGYGPVSSKKGFSNF